MLAACELEYEEKVPGLQGVAHLTERAHMDHLRDNGYLLWGQVPLLCIDGMKLVQSGAIVRYLARRGGLAGETDQQMAMCDAVAEGIEDWMSQAGRAFEYSGGYQPRQDQWARIFQANARYLPTLEGLAAASPTGFLMGSLGCAGMTYADVLLLEGLETATSRDPEVLDDFPKLRALHERLREMPRFKAFFASDFRKTKTQGRIPAYQAEVMRALS